MKRTAQAGFTLLELMVVVAIIGVLSTQAAFSASVHQKKAKRTEVTYALEDINKAQAAYFMEYGEYAPTFDELDFHIDGGERVSATIVKGGLYSYTLSQPWGASSYYCLATGNIDGDGFPDVVVLEAGRP